MILEEFIDRFKDEIKNSDGKSIQCGDVRSKFDCAICPFDDHDVQCSKALYNAIADRYPELTL